MTRHKLVKGERVKFDLDESFTSLLFMVRSCSDVMIEFTDDQRKLLKFTIQKNKVCVGLLCALLLLFLF